MTDETTRVLQIIFVSDQKQFIQVLSKKGKSDYLLNVNKIMRDKFDHDIMFPNKIQSFLINYEIKKISSINLSLHLISIQCLMTIGKNL